MTFPEQTNAGPTPFNNNDVPGEYIVTLTNKEASEADLRAALGQFVAHSVSRIAPGVFLVQFTDTDPGLDRLQILNRESAVIEAVQPNHRYHTQGL